MPQGRHKVPFSGKAKKLQLKSKKQKKGGLPLLQGNSDEEVTRVDILNKQPHASHGGRNPNRYALQFYHESEAELKKRKEEALHAVTCIPENEFEIDSSSCYPPELDFPKRPPWSFNMSREQLEAKENRYFTEYVSKIEKSMPSGEIGYFELNLETWRQLWRVLEMSDIVLFIVDIRYASLMFPPSLYNYVTESLKKEMILVLNKIDLAPAPLVVAWMYHFRKTYPSLKIITFTSYPSYNLRNKEKSSGLQIRLRRGRMRMAAEGALKLLEACKEIVGDQVDLSSWKSKISEEMETEYESDELEVEETVTAHVDTSFFEHVKYQDGALTIGCVGQPNVGKSSLMNSIMGKKVVSVSRTPGHTKHFQTIYLTKNVRLCDCPGLVFPSKVSKPLQVLMGNFPIAQLREPFSSIRFLAQRLKLPQLLHISHPEGESEWSAMDICEAWAVKRGFFTARAARPDVHRAANHLLRMALEGKICLCLYPPGYSGNKDFWSNHEDVSTIMWIQAKNTEVTTHYEKPDSTSEDSDKQLDDSAKETDTDSEDSEEEERAPIVSGNMFTALDIRD